MVSAIGTPRRRAESGIYWFRKRVPDRLRAKVGKSEIKCSLLTRDPDVARLRNLEAMREWATYDLVAVIADRVVPVQCKSAAPPTESRSGEAVTASAPPANVPPATALPKLQAVFAAEAELSAATVKRWSPVISHLVAHLGHDELPIPKLLFTGIFGIMSYVLIVDRRSNFARFALGQNFGLGAQVLPTRIKLCHEPGVEYLRFCRILRAEAALSSRLPTSARRSSGTCRRNQ